MKKDEIEKILTPISRFIDDQYGVNHPEFIGWIDSCNFTENKKTGRITFMPVIKFERRNMRLIDGYQPSDILDTSTPPCEIILNGEGGFSADQ